jgi:hypothetical protein
MEGKTEEDAMKARADFEVPPLGYKGSLKGTSWDPDVMADEFGNGESFNEGVQ